MRWNDPGPDGQMNPIYGEYWLNAAQRGMSTTDIIAEFEGTPKPTAAEVAREIARAVRRSYAVH